MIIEAPGLYKGLSNEDYHASKGISNSQMSYLLPPHSPKEFWYKYLSGKAPKQEDQSHFSVGSAVHTLVFEPETFKDRFYTVVEIPKRNTIMGKTAYEAMEKTAAGRSILDKADQDLVFEMAANITSHKMWKNLKATSGNIEDSLAWRDPESGTLLRSRPDYYNNDVIIDLKTTKDSSDISFKRSVVEYAYHRQAALAIDGLTALTGRFYSSVVLFVVDKNPPHLVRCYVLTGSAVDQGRIDYKHAAMNYSKCMESGRWDGHPEIIEDIDIPSWAYRSYDNE